MRTRVFTALFRAVSPALRSAIALSLWLAGAAGAATQAELETKAAETRTRMEQVLATEGEASEAGADALFSLGNALSNAKRYEEALAMYQRAARSVAARLGEDHASHAVVLHEVADTLDDLGRYAQARDVFVRAANIFIDRNGVAHARTARTLEALGGTVSRLKDYEHAERVWRAALRSREALDGADAPKALETKLRLAHALHMRARVEESNRLLGEVVAAWRRSPKPDDDERLAATLQWADSFAALDQAETGLRIAQEVLAERIATRGADSLEAHRARLKTAIMLGAVGRWPEALEIQQQVLAAYTRLYGPDDNRSIGAASDSAFALRKLGRYGEAARVGLGVAQRAEKAKGAEDLSVMLAWLDYSETLGHLGQLAESGLMQQRIARQLANKLGDDDAIAMNAVNLLAGTLFDLGRPAEAAQALLPVIEGRTRLYGENHSETLAARHNRAAYLMYTGAHAEALALVQDAIARIEGWPTRHASRPALGYYYRTLGDVLRAMGQRNEARTALRRALALSETDKGFDHAFTGNVLTFLGPTLDDPAERIEVFGRALRIGRASDAPAVVWRAADGLRAAHAELGNTALAVLYGKQAINAIQALRRNVSELNQGLQKSFLDDKRPVYTQTADLLIAEGRLAEGQQVMALLKEEEYFEFVSRSQAADAVQGRLTLNGQEAAWLARYNAVSDRLVEIARSKAALDARLRRGSLSADEKTLLDRHEADLKVAREAFDAATRQIAEDARRQAAAGGAQRLGSEVIDSVRAMRSDLKQLGHGAVLVHYLVAQDKLWILLTTPEVQVARESKVGAADLNRRIDALRTAFRNPRSDAQAPALELYRLLLAPIAADLEQAQAATLMLSLDGALRYVPFAALHDGQRYAVEKWRFAILTEAAKSKIKDVPQATWSMTGLGLTKAVPGFSALPAVREELAGLVRGGGKDGTDNGVMDGEALFDEAFTVQRMKAVLGDPNPVLHIASHFKFTPGTEADSYLVMGDGGKLSLQQIRQDDLQFNVDLLTLSACETAVGDNARGQEVEGLGALAQKQGAKAVLATLWPVADASTGLFMREMYRRRGAERLTKAEAVRQVQLAFLRGQLKGAGGVDRSARVEGAVPRAAPVATPASSGYAHPFYWAPFILMGNWL